MNTTPGRLRIRSDLAPGDQALLRLHRWSEAGICRHLATVNEPNRAPVYVVQLPDDRYASVGQRALLAISDHPTDAAEALAELAQP